MGTDTVAHKGYTEDQILGQHISIFYPEEDRQDGLPHRLLATAREEGRVEHSGWRVRSDGTRFWADVPRSRGSRRSS